MTQTYDAVVIGTGQSGPALAARLTKEGLKTAVIERKLFGGTCVNVGCIPTKALVASARAAYMARRGADFGVVIDGTIGVDMKQVKARKDAIVSQSNQGVTNWLKNMANCTVYEGHARFEDAHTVRVNGDLLEGEKIFINAGARAFVPVSARGTTGAQDLELGRSEATPGPAPRRAVRGRRGPRSQSTRWRRSRASSDTAGEDSPD